MRKFKSGLINESDLCYDAAILYNALVFSESSCSVQLAPLYIYIHIHIDLGPSGCAVPCLLSLRDWDFCAYIMRK